MIEQRKFWTMFGNENFSMAQRIQKTFMQKRQLNQVL